MSDFAKDYVQVNERILAFRKEHPEGSLQSEIVTLTDKLVVVRGVAYRTPDDVRPGIGHSSLEIPGKTPYTRGSELENAETSAWGRALAALGYEVKRGIATQNEIDAKQEPINGNGNGNQVNQPVPYRPNFSREAPRPTVVPSEKGGIPRVTAISSRNGSNPKTGKPWTKYTIETDDGQKYSTFSETHAVDAGYAKDNGLGVLIAAHTSQYGNDLDGLTVVMADPADDVPSFDPDKVLETAIPF